MKHRPRFPPFLPAVLFLLATASASLPAEEPRVFSDLGEGVAFAREGERLLLFLLVENFAEESAAILAAVNEELADRGDEFAIVRCRHESADHRKLFEDRFKQDPDKMPLGIVATASGEVIIGTNGKSPEVYRLLIRAARVRGGKEKDPGKIAAIEEEIEESDERMGDSIFGLKREDVGPKMVLLTDYRIWTFENGATLEAALLEAKDTIGVFVKRDGGRTEANFNDLSPADIAFLTKLLGGGGKE